MTLLVHQFLCEFYTWKIFRFNGNSDWCTLPDHSSRIVEGSVAKDGRIGRAELKEEVVAEVLGAVLHFLYDSRAHNAKAEE